MLPFRIKRIGDRSRHVDQNQAERGITISDDDGFVRSFRANEHEIFVLEGCAVLRLTHIGPGTVAAYSERGEGTVIRHGMPIYGVRLDHDVPHAGVGYDVDRRAVADDRFLGIAAALLDWKGFVL